ncbi:hypothetical protein QJU93_09880 [Pasteurella skyensis]|uniref:Uncharacterized protein n=1 Tax=Phocoenobacter skyensis TaxID=97481 RepID=A0AAJ6NBD0_9PAST|nr:hypothetical protein [Pasteurella skyensis]MDP8173663.1 hypothetical protein [Pasteurella skyensis]MDP8178031.1 hypothetical protein [Pasteurella skyensis]
MRKTTIALAITSMTLNDRELKLSNQFYKRNKGSVLDHKSRNKKQQLKQIYGRK